MPAYGRLASAQPAGVWGLYGGGRPVSGRTPSARSRAAPQQVPEGDLSRAPVGQAELPQPLHHGRVQVEGRLPCPHPARRQPDNCGRDERFRHRRQVEHGLGCHWLQGAHLLDPEAPGQGDLTVRTTATASPARPWERTRCSTIGQREASAVRCSRSAPMPIPPGYGHRPSEPFRWQVGAASCYMPGACEDHQRSNHRPSTSQWAYSPSLAAIHTAPSLWETPCASLATQVVPGCRHASGSVSDAARQAGTWLRQMRRTLNGTNSIKVRPIIVGHTLLEAALVN
jgi:hypothetical protein